MSEKRTLFDDDQQSIEQLQQRYELLNKQKITAEANRDNAKKRLEELQEESLDKFGTSDVEELREKLAQMKTENEKKRREYQLSLDKIESDLDTVEKNFALAEEPQPASEESA